MTRRIFLRRAAMLGFGVLCSGTGLYLPFAEARDIKPFSFVHLCDLHLDVNGDNNWQFREKSVPLFIDTLRQVGRLPKLRFILFGGDQIHAGPNDRDSLTVFKRWVSLLDVPSFMLLGNTEVSPLKGLSTLAREDYLGAWKGKGLRPRQSSWAFDPVPGVRFIGFDVTVDGRPYGEAGPERLAWLDRELRASRDRQLVIIATHQLLYPTTPLDLEPAWSLWMVRNHADVRDLISKYPNVRLVISGHHHASSVATVGRITYVSDPAIVSYPCAFRLFTVTGQGIHLRNVGLDDRGTVTRARELLRDDPLARVFDHEAPDRILQYALGMNEQDREATIGL